VSATIPISRLARRADTLAKEVEVATNDPEAEGVVERLGLTPSVDSIATISS
jgi:hypothetical protein